MFEFKRWDHEQKFYGRFDELVLLDEYLIRRNPPFTPLIISGMPGVGKTALMKYWLETRRISDEVLWVRLDPFNQATALDELLKHIDGRRERYSRNEGFIVIVDDSEVWNNEELEKATNRIYNYKAVSSLVFIGRSSANLRRSEQIYLEALSQRDSLTFLEELTGTQLDENQLADLMKLSNGIPLAIELLKKIISVQDKRSPQSAINEPLYELSNNILVPKKEIVAATSPIIISAGESLIDSLKKQPKNLHNITPREFEKLLAELLRDMGWDVELTKQTRDGGADILAYLNTDVGKILCLVEAKHYREDRKIGVELVRTLYGTLCDYQANSAMMVTSSSFTKGAKEFQQKHEYQLTLREYSDIIEWIWKYGNRIKD